MAASPQTIHAGEIGTWTFHYTPSSKLAKGAILKFDMGKELRIIDWEVPTTDLKQVDNLIYLLLPNAKVVQGKEVQRKDSPVPEFLFTLPIDIKGGETISIVMGALKDAKDSKAKKSKTEEIGNQAQTFVQRRRQFHLYIDPKGKGQFGDPEVFNMDIRGNKLEQVKIVCPSFVAKNKRFDVIIRFEDAYGNLTSYHAGDTLMELSYEGFRENLKWKLFVPETGYLTLPNLYFNEDGIYYLKLKDLNTQITYSSAPISCQAEEQRSLYWGQLHGETERADATTNIESCLRHIRDDLAFNFFATSPFESCEEMDNETWKNICSSVAEFNEENRLVAFAGFQYIGKPKEEGVRQIIYAKDNKPLLRSKDARYSSLKKMYKTFNPKEVISVPLFTAAKGLEFDFKNFDPDFERVVEIYNCWGCSERSQKEGNLCPIDGKGKNDYKESNEGFLIQALQKNHRFGFVAGGLDDREIFSGLYDSDQAQYPAGMTGIIATAHTREALFDALYKRSCFATTGERLLLDFKVADLRMGQEASATEKPGLKVIRHLSGFAAGTQKLQSVEIILNGSVLHSYEPDDHKFSFEYDDLTPLVKHAIGGKDKKPAFVFYYLRVTQEDGHMAWSSPIWIDL